MQKHRKSNRICSASQERELLNRAANGDSSAFTEMVDLLERPVYRLAYATLGNREDAEDVTQETFLKLWNSIGQFRGNSSLLTYTLQIAKNTAFDLLRKKSSHPFSSLSVENDAGETMQYELKDPDPTSDPSVAYARKEQIHEVRRAIADLPEEQRIILTLRDMEGRSYEEIEKILNLPAGTVKSRLFRARLSLKNLLTERNIL